MEPTRRALVIAYDFPPHAAVGTQRTLRLVRYLSETGWDVRVLTAEPASFRSDTPVDQRLLERVPASIRVLRASAWRPVDRVQRTVRTLLRGREADGVPGAAAAQPASAVAPKGARRNSYSSPRGRDQYRVDDSRCRGWMDAAGVFPRPFCHARLEAQRDLLVCAAMERTSGGAHAGAQDTRALGGGLQRSVGTGAVAKRAHRAAGK